jgi:hypothetical protein
MYGSPTGSGRICCAFWVNLIDTQRWVYPTAFFDDPDKFDAFCDYYLTFTTFDGFTGFYGECYNYFYRALAFDKVLYADYGPWLAAH